MTLTHGYLPINEKIVGIMDDTVHDRLGDGALILGGGIEPFIPLIRVVLSAEDCRSVFSPELYEFQQVVGFLRSQTLEQPLVQDEKLHFLVAFARFNSSNNSGKRI